MDLVVGPALLTDHILHLIINIATDWDETYVIILNLDVGEARILNPVLHAPGFDHIALNASLPLDFGPNLSPLIQSGILRHGSVVAEKMDIGVGVLDPPTRLGAPVRFLI